MYRNTFASLSRCDRFFAVGSYQTTVYRLSKPQPCGFHPHNASVLHAAGIDTQLSKADSTGAAAVSATVCRGAPLHAVLQEAERKSGSLFGHS